MFLLASDLHDPVSAPYGSRQRATACTNLSPQRRGGSVQRHACALEKLPGHMPWFET